MKWFLCVLALLWANVANAANFDDAVQATCRITTPPGMMNGKMVVMKGTGIVVDVGDQYVGILTNAHVVGNHQTVKCEFYRQGYQSVPIDAAVVSRVNTKTVDAALLAIRRDVFGGLAPKPVPIASSSYVVAPGEEIMSVGCPEGSWPMGWIGHAERYESTPEGYGPFLAFLPPPKQGRSGSAVFNKAGEIVGLIVARDGKEDKDVTIGYACTLQAMRAELAADAKTRGPWKYTGSTTLVSWQETQCGPGGCGPRGCPVPQGYDQDSLRNRGQRRQQQAPQQQPSVPERGSSPWPGFGEPKSEKPVTDPAVVDALKAIADTQAQIAESLKSKEPAKGEMVPVPDKLEAPKPAGPDPETLKVLEKIGAAVQKNSSDIQETQKQVATLERAVAPALKFQEFKEEVLGKLSGKPQEPTESKLEAKITHVLWTVLVVGVAFAVVSLLVLFNKGVGLIGKFTADRAAKHPENARYQAAAERWQELDKDFLEFARKSPALKGMVKAQEKPAPTPEAPKAEVPVTQAAA